MTQKARRPLLWSVCCTIVVHMALEGGVGMALVWMLMIDCYIRPGEAVALETSQILPGTKVDTLWGAVILLLPDERGVGSKTGEYNESLVVSRSWLSDLLASWKKTLRIIAFWDFGLRELREEFLRATTSFGLE